MRRVAVAVLVMMSLFVGVALAGAGEGKLSTLNGKVVSVDAKASTLMVKVESTPGQPSDMSFSIGPDTKVFKDGEPISLSDIQEGSMVTISFKNDNGKSRAVAISVGGKAT